MLGRYLTPVTSIWDLRGKVVVIAEKPKASKNIAFALSTQPLIRKYNDIPYYEIKKQGLLILVVSTIGHLYELHTLERGYPVFKYEWVPAYIANEREKKYTRVYLEAIKELCKGADYYVNACDYDIEGSVIGYLIIKFHGNEKKALRAKFSSLTSQELRDAFNKLLPLDYPMIEAGLCRHELDWMWGINVSRALMSAVRVSTGKKITLSAGRVQTPTLKYVYEYEVKRNLFVPLPQYIVTVVVRKGNTPLQVEYINNPVEREEEAIKIKQHLKNYGYLVVENIEVKKVKYTPPPPFNLSDLQEEAARIYGFSPMKTQSIAEELYLDALISYPRTNSQKLPPTLDYKSILLKLGEIEEYKDLASRLLSETRGVLRPVEGEKEDPAHPAIYPTGIKPRGLTREQALIYDLIVRRFLAAFALPAIVLHTRLELTTPDGKYKFATSGLIVEYSGWFTYYPFHVPGERQLPRLIKGEKLEVVKVSIRGSYTRPPPQLKKIDVLKWMENVGIGTEATRAIILEKLFTRNYLESSKKGVAITDLGIGVIEVIERFFPDLTMVELTRRFEDLMNEIITGKRRKDEVVNEARRVLTDLLEKFNQNINEIGLHLARKLALINDYEKCRIPSCRGEVYMNNLCRLHYQALEEINNAYKQWSLRKKISFEEFLEKIGKMKSTGRYIREVVEYYLSQKHR